jgi:uncharacterized protein with PIN domain
MSLFKEEEPQPIEILGKELRCPVCNNHLFFTRQAQLNTAIASFFNLDWANRSATCFVCAKCTHISWFLGEE